MGKIEDLDKKIEQLKERKRKILAKENAQERKDRTRQHIIVGAVVTREFPQLLPEILEKVSGRDRTFLLERLSKEGIEISKTPPKDLFQG